MDMTIGELLNELERPENAGQIKHLANIKHLEHVENLRELSVLAGTLARFVMRFTKGHMNAFMELSECENVTDIADFKRTVHYEKIKNSTISSLHDLEGLKELSELRHLGKNS